jgi:hypothetical protein
MAVLFRNGLKVNPTEPVSAPLFITKQKYEVNGTRKNCSGHFMFSKIFQVRGSTSGLYPV